MLGSVVNGTFNAVKFTDEFAVNVKQSTALFVVLACKGDGASPVQPGAEVEVVGKIVILVANG